MEIVYLVKSKSAAETEKWSPLAREQSRLGYSVRIYPELDPPDLAALLGHQPPAVLHLVGLPLSRLKQITALKLVLSFTLVLEAPGANDLGLPWSLAGRMARRWLQPVLGQGFDGFIARSRSERNLLAQTLGVETSKILCLSSGVDADRFQFDPEARRLIRERLGLGHWETFCLQIGSLRSEADVQLILEAGENLFRDGRALFGLAGDCPSAIRNRVEQRARELGLLHRIRFLEEIPSEDLPGFYSAADLGLCFEANASLQAAAMACRLPLIPPAENFLAWWREGDLAERFGSASVNRVNRKLARLISEPDFRREQGEAARRFVEMECSWRAQAQKLCRWYREQAGTPAVRESGEAREQLAA